MEPIVINFVFPKQFRLQYEPNKNLSRAFYVQTFPAHILPLITHDHLP